MLLIICKKTFRADAKKKDGISPILIYKQKILRW